MKTFYVTALFLCLNLLVGQAHAQLAEEMSCSNLSKRIASLNKELVEIENNWVTWTIRNEDSNLLTVPLEIAKESLTIWHVNGGVPSMLLVFGAVYPLGEIESFLRKKGVEGRGSRAFFKVASAATMFAIYPFGVATNLISYSAAFTYNEIVKKKISFKLDGLNRQYQESC